MFNATCAMIALVALLATTGRAEEPAPDAERFELRLAPAVDLETTLDGGALGSGSSPLGAPPDAGPLSLDTLSLGGTLSLDALGEVDQVETASDYPGLGCLGVNLRMSGDFSSRTLYNDRTGRFFHATFIGLDTHKVFTGPGGDWGTAVLQPYMTRLDNFAAAPGFFDDGDDWELVWRIFNFNYAVCPKGALNFRVGHFEIPFGLEQVINTNGTLLDYIHGRNIGVKGDWGATLNGVQPGYEYEFALSRGSGNEWINQGDPFIISGRVATPREEPATIGISGYYGDVFSYATPDDPVRRWRGALDAIFGVGPFELRGEVSYGENNGSEFAATVAEVHWTSSKCPLTIYSQAFSFNSKAGSLWDTNAINNLGFRWTPNSHWAISGQWRQDLSTFSGMPNQGIFALQFRFRT